MDRPLSIKAAVAILFISTVFSLPNILALQEDPELLHQYGSLYAPIVAASTILIWLLLTIFVFFQRKWARNVTSIFLITSTGFMLNQLKESVDYYDALLTILDVSIVILLFLPASSIWFNSRGVASA